MSTFHRPASAPIDRVQRARAIALVGFLLSATAWGAYQLGCFVRATPLEDYLTQLDAAVAREDWIGDRQNSVVELTRTVMDIWPDSPKARTARANIARRMAKQATAEWTRNEQHARQLGAAALEFDPSVRTLLPRAIFAAEDGTARPDTSAVPYQEVKTPHTAQQGHDLNFDSPEDEEFVAPPYAESTDPP